MFSAKEHTLHFVLLLRSKNLWIRIFDDLIVNSVIETKM